MLAAARGRPMMRPLMTDEAWDEAQEVAELLRDGDPDAAIAEAARLVTKSPRNEYAWFFLANAHFEKGENAQALKAYVKSLEIAPKYVGALVGVGNTLRLLGRYDEAIKVGRELLGRDPHDADALHLLGLTHFARGDRRAAREFLERFLATRPEAEIALEVSGMLQVLSGDVLPFPGTEHN